MNKPGPLFFFFRGDFLPLSAFTARVRGLSAKDFLLTSRTFVLLFLIFVHNNEPKISGKKFLFRILLTTANF